MKCDECPRSVIMAEATDHGTEFRILCNAPWKNREEFSNAVAERKCPFWDEYIKSQEASE